MISTRWKSGGGSLLLGYEVTEPEELEVEEGDTGHLLRHPERRAH